jgi:hypothetical protein
LRGAVWNLHSFRIYEDSRGRVEDAIPTDGEMDIWMDRTAGKEGVCFILDQKRIERTDGQS